MSDWIQAASDWLWGPPMLTLVMGTGIYLVIRLRAVQVRELVPAFRAAFSRAQRCSGQRVACKHGAIARVSGLPDVIVVLAIGFRTFQ